MDLKVVKATVEMSEEIFNVILKCSDESNFLACDSKDRIENGFTVDSCRSLIETTENTNNEYLVLLDKDKVIGTLVMLGQSRRRSKHKVSLGMNILKEYWGKGGGQLLLDRCITLFNENEEIQRLELEVYTNNEKAVNLYKKFNFKVEGIKEKYVLIEGNFYDAYSMAIIK